MNWRRNGCFTLKLCTKIQLFPGVQWSRPFPTRFDALLCIFAAGNWLTGSGADYFRQLPQFRSCTLHTTTATAQHTTSTPDICQMDFIPLISAQKAGQLDYLCRRDLDFFGYPANSNLITPTWHTWKSIRFKSVDCQHLRYPWGPGLKNRKTSKPFPSAWDWQVASGNSTCFWNVPPWTSWRNL